MAIDECKSSSIITNIDQPPIGQSTMTITVADFPNYPIAMTIRTNGTSQFTDSVTGKVYVIRFENPSGMRSDVRWNVNVNGVHHVLGYVVDIKPYVPPAPKAEARFKF